jgi:hypothetical protein
MNGLYINCLGIGIGTNQALELHKPKIGFFSLELQLF